MASKILLFWVASGLLFGGGWDDVVALRKGSLVSVAVGQQKVDGRFDSATASTVTILQDGQLKSFERDKVARVDARPRLNRAARIGLGAAIGVAVGAVLDASVGLRFRNEGQEIGPALYGIGIGLGAGIGAASGSGVRTIYRAPVK